MQENLKQIHTPDSVIPFPNSYLRTCGLRTHRVTLPRKAPGPQAPQAGEGRRSPPLPGRQACSCLRLVSACPVRYSPLAAKPSHPRNRGHQKPLEMRMRPQVSDCRGRKEAVLSLPPSLAPSGSLLPSLPLSLSPPLLPSLSLLFPPSPSLSPSPLPSPLFPSPSSFLLLLPPPSHALPQHHCLSSAILSIHLLCLSS